MKTTEDPFFHLAPRAMKYDDQIEEEVRALITKEVLTLGKSDRIKYLMKATKGHYSPELVTDILDSYEETSH
jgi:hypothetical protein